MNWGLYAAFVAATMALIATPGPIVALVLSESSRHGRRVGLATVAGTTIAGAAQLALVTVGFAAVVATFSHAFEIVRWAGAAYLIWLGVSALKRAGKPDDGPALEPAERVSAAFRRGLVVALSNPKTLVFFSAFFPLFVDRSLPAAPQLAVMAVTYVTIGFSMDMGWMLLGDRAGRALSGPRARAALERVSGGVLIAGGLALAAKRA